MSRVKSGVTTRSRHKKIIKQAKGFYGRRKNTFRAANQAVEKSAQYAYRDRKVKKRVFKNIKPPSDKKMFRNVFEYYI